MNIESLKNCYCQKVIPLYFDESMSFYEQLCNIGYKLNEVIKQTNINTEFINNWNSNLDEINQKLLFLEQEFNNLESNIYNYIDEEFLKAYNELLLMFNEQVEMMKNQLNSELIILKNYIDENDSNLQKQIDNIIYGKINLYNPTNGLVEPIEKVVSDIYSILRNNALTCTEFDVSGINAQNFDNLGLTATEFDLNNKKYIGIFNKYLNLSTGEYDSLQNIINRLFSYHQNGIDVTNFEALNLSCENYDIKEISAYEFDFNNPLIV